jgi:hypothetical protein
MRGSLQLAERKVKWLVSSEALLPDELRRFAPVQALLERARSQVSIQDRLVSRPPGRLAHPGTDVATVDDAL